MCYVLQMHIVQPKHYLVNDVGRLRLGEAGQLREPLEQLATLDQLGDDVVVLRILDQVDDSDDVGVRLLAQDR